MRKATSIELVKSICIFQRVFNWTRYRNYNKNMYLGLWFEACAPINGTLHRKCSTKYVSEWSRSVGPWGVTGWAWISGDPELMDVESKSWVAMKRTWSNIRCWIRLARTNISSGLSNSKMFSWWKIDVISNRNRLIRLSIWKTKLYFHLSLLRMLKSNADSVDFYKSFWAINFQGGKDIMANPFLFLIKWVHLNSTYEWNTYNIY